jgi:hypothetical protein
MKECTSGGDRTTDAPRGGPMQRILTEQDIDAMFQAPSAILYKHSPT